VPGVGPGSDVAVGFDWESIRLFPAGQREQLAGDRGMP
jgi:hypothetical protein